MLFSLLVYIYMIGLTHLHLIPGKQVIVQLSKSVTLTPKLLHLNVLIQDIENDPYLSEIPACLRPQVLQTIYMCTGCDYISFVLLGLESAAFSQHSSSMPHLLHLDNLQAL